MQQVKLFKGVENEVAQLETQINDWLKSSGAKVLQITGNIAPQSRDTGEKVLGTGHTPSDVLVVVLYEAAG